MSKDIAKLAGLATFETWKFVCTTHLWNSKERKAKGQKPMRQGLLCCRKRSTKGGTVNETESNG